MVTGEEMADRERANLNRVLLPICFGASYHHAEAFHNSPDSSLLRIS